MSSINGINTADVDNTIGLGVNHEVPRGHPKSGTMQVSYQIPDSMGQTLSEIFAWTFFLIMLGEVVYGETEKKKILAFWGIKS